MVGERMVVTRGVVGMVVGKVAAEAVVVGVVGRGQGSVATSGRLRQRGLGGQRSLRPSVSLGQGWAWPKRLDQGGRGVLSCRCAWQGW